MGEPLVVGSVGAPFGVKGWLKFRSFTQPPNNALEYKPLWLQLGERRLDVSIEQWQTRPQGLVVLFDQIEDRTGAEQWVRSQLVTEREALPALDDGEYYWHQLIGLEVRIGDVAVGRVASLMETGANDVLVVKHGSDKRERLIPYLPGQVVKAVDLNAGTIVVDWDPDF